MVVVQPSSLLLGKEKKKYRCTVRERPRKAEQTGGLHN